MSRLIKTLQGSQRQPSAAVQDQLSKESNSLSSERGSQLLENESTSSDFIDSGSLALEIEQDALAQIEPDDCLLHEDDNGFNAVSDGDPVIGNDSDDNQNKLSEEVESLYLDIAAQERDSLEEETEKCVRKVVFETECQEIPECIDQPGNALHSDLQESSAEIAKELENPTPVQAQHVYQNEGLHSEEFSDTSQSIAVMFAEHGGGEKNKNRWIYYGLVIFFSVSAFSLYTLNIGELFSSQQSVIYSDRLSEEEKTPEAFDSVEGLVDLADAKQLQEAALALPELPLEEQLSDNKISEQPRLANTTRQNKDNPVSGVEFSRVRKAPQEITAINEAYRLYVAGELQQALSLYQKALSEKPDSIDAKLGLGAVLYELKDYVAAQRYFEMVLAMDASHVFAKSKKIEIAQILSRESTSVVLNESVFFNQQLPVSNEYVSDNPANYFYLGQAYAQRSQWSEAQQAFFQAHSMDKTNDLYIYNLAVSIDHMQKSQLALPYYELVLQRKAIVDLDYQKIQHRVDSIRKNQ